MIFFYLFSLKTFALKPEPSVKAGPQKVKDASKKYQRPLGTAGQTLDKIVQDALNYHPSIEADKEAFSASKDVIDQAVAGYMPSVDMRMSLGRENIRRDFKVTALNPLPNTGAISSTRSDPSLSIRQILFDGMGTASRVARARSQRHQAFGTLGVTTDSIVVDAASATIDLWRLQNLLQIVDKNIQFHQMMRNKVAEIVQAGAAPISDLYQMEARLQDTMVSKNSILSDLEAARSKFIEVVGKEPPSHVKQVHLPTHLIPASVDAAVKMALDNNSAIKVARSNVQIAEANYRESGSKLMPTISLEFEGEKDRNMSGTVGFQDRLTAMVVARHNVFNGGADMAKSREATKRITEARARVDVSRRQTERTIRSAWGEIKNTRTKANYLKALIREKRQIRDSYLSEFTLGKRTLTEILDAADGVFMAEASYTTAVATTDINTIVLSVGTGQFLPYIKKDYAERLPDDDISGAFPPEEMIPQVSVPLPVKKSQVKDITPKSLQKIPFNRKTIFDQRKEARQQALQANTEG